MNTFRAACKTVFICYFFLSAAFSVAQTLSGTVLNQTTGKPSAGDDVILLRLANGMLEESHTKTDGQGAFTLAVQFAGSPHVVRVFHQGVNYDQTVVANVPLDVKVFDSAAKVQGVSGYISIVKVESDGKNFSITELHAIENESAPPRTQANPRNLEVSLPDNAKMDSVMVSGPSGIPVKASPEPVAGQDGRYAIGFPLRPGQTKYWVKYHLPYQDHVTFHPILGYSTRMFSVQYPKSMTFLSAEKDGFHPIVDQDGMKVEAIVKAKAGVVPTFQISGVGALPPDRQAAQASSRTVPAQPPATSASRPVQPQATAGQSETATSQKSNATLWAAIAAVAVALAVLVFMISRRRAANQQAALETLKEQLFELENARLRGSISAEQYAATKRTLNQNLEQVVGKGSQGQ